MNAGMLHIKIATFVLMLGLTVQISAQTATTPTPTAQAPQTAEKKRANVTQGQPVIVETVPNAPQVVTLLHRLSGLKMFRLLLRSGEARAIERLDEGFNIKGEVHTNVIAGLALGDGETVAAWLPEVEAEAAPLATQAPKTAVAVKPPSVAPQPLIGARAFAWETPNLTVVARDHRKLAAKYIGLDGITGLSILKLAQSKFSARTEIVDAQETAIAVGQRVHLFAPEPVTQTVGVATGAVYAKIGETEARITRVMRAPTGGIARVKIVSPRLSAANIGGVVLNDAGQTIGIIDAVKAREATVVPATLIRGAAKRVLARQASVPRPWLGIRGEPLGSFPVEQLLRNGWQSDVANTLAQHQRGILLTGVLPGSPASTAELKPGDVILRVNEGVVQSAEDFSWVLQEAGPGGSLTFTIARPGKVGTEAVDVKLSEAPTQVWGFSTHDARTWSPMPSPRIEAGQLFMSAALFANGIEAITLLPKVASRLGSSGGLLVVYVEPATPAFKSGLRPGDVIESINGQQITGRQTVELFEPGETYSCTVIRDKQKLVLTLESKTKQ